MSCILGSNGEKSQFPISICIIVHISALSRLGTQESYFVPTTTTTHSIESPSIPLYVIAMLNFGVREVALSTAPQGPGWAYVPDTGINASVAALQPAARKRHRTELTSNTELSAKQDAKILRDIKALEQENHRDVAIPIPERPKDNLGRGMIRFPSSHIYLEDGKKSH